MVTPQGFNALLKLVEEPPEHIKHMQEVVSLKKIKEQHGQKSTLDILADELDIGRMTVKRALSYRRLMQAEGVTEPYRLLREPPAAASRWKRRRRLGKPAQRSVKGARRRDEFPV